MERICGDCEVNVNQEWHKPNCSVWGSNPTYSEYQVRFSIILSRQVANAIEELSETGLFGGSFAEVIQTLVYEKVRALQLEGWLKEGLFEG